MQSVVIHYQEIALKGRNRPWFVSTLVRNIRRATRDLDVRAVRALMGRIEVELGADADWDAIEGRLGRVFGIANFSRAGRVAADVDAIAAAILEDLGGTEAESFRVSARRADKRFPLTSPQIEREVGGRIREARGWRVDLEAPALTLRVEVLTGEAFYSFGKARGAGGLPTGSSGRVACLLSGGIDSPVAAWRMMRRGCTVLLVHFHSYPILSRASQEKVQEIAALLTRYQLASTLCLVPFGDLQQQIVLAAPPPLRVVLYRRLMMRIAESLARRWRAKALVTGEVVGQVASQTIENLSAIDAAARMPVLRPLIGTDKDEIVAEAIRLGTYPISIIPDQDCCTLFTPRHPATKARLGDVEAAEAGLSIDDLVSRAVEATVVEEFTFPPDRRLPRAVRVGILTGPSHSRKERADMIHETVDGLQKALEDYATITMDRVSVGRSEVPGDVIDSLARTAVFGPTAEVKGTARWIIRQLAAARGIRAASIHDLYMAMGRGEAGGFTVPAINVRASAYLTSRAVLRAVKRLNVGAFILEIARSEIGYTEQRPHEYSAVMMAAALREGFTGPLFIQGDHVQTNAKKYRSADRDTEIEGVRQLIVEEMAAGFYNIDIDTSTLVDLEQATLEEQQRENYELAADFTESIRKREPAGVTVSVGGEIGEVGGKNSDVHELHAFMKGYNASLARRGAYPGISKISVQTGTAHGGFVGPDGKVRMDVKIDIETLGELSRVAREEYGLGGAVQHGASTLPPDAFDAFPNAGACEIHLATDFQNMLYDHASFPGELREEMYAWLREHAAEERKPKDTEEQFIYKARKKALGPFKRRLWELPDEVAGGIGQALEERFAFLMTKLKVNDTADVVTRFVRPAEVALDRDAEIQAAGGKITAAERKAEGLAD